MKRFYILFIIVLLTGCKDGDYVDVAKFNNIDVANKVIVLLDNYNIPIKIITEKSLYGISVPRQNEMSARKILIKYNFYHQNEDLNDLLESKFASLSKLESVKGNLLESREISNKLNSLPNILRASVTITGEAAKRISVIIISLNDLEKGEKNSIESYLKGVASESSKLSVNYFVPEVLLDEK